MLVAHASNRAQLVLFLSHQVEELLEILSHPRLSPERKRPFARFLIWVYLNTEGDKYQSGASSLSVDTSVVCVCL